MTTTGYKLNTHRGTATVRIPISWWRTFMSEPIIEDATGYDPEVHGVDRLLEVTGRIVTDSRQARRTKSDITLELDPTELEVLIEHANWYAYYWGEQMRNECSDWSEAGVWALRGRSSRTLERRLLEISAELALVLGI